MLGSAVGAGVGAWIDFLLSGLSRLLCSFGWYISMCTPQRAAHARFLSCTTGVPLLFARTGRGGVQIMLSLRTGAYLAHRGMLPDRPGNANH